MDFQRSCSSCSHDTHCCVFTKDRGFTFVGIKDAQRIHRATKKAFREFLDYSPLPRKLIRALKSEDPLLEGGLRYNQLDKGRILRLKKQRNGDCIFLNEGKCSIYLNRPNICRIYPHWAIRLLNGKLKVVEHDPLPSCPIIKAKKGISKKERARLTRVFQNIEKETQEYKRVKGFLKGKIK